jgi:hypothetical protein
MGRIPLALIIIYFAGGVRRKRSRQIFAIRSGVKKTLQDVVGGRNS